MSNTAPDPIQTNGAATPEAKPGAPAAEPTLAERREKLAGIAAKEQAKLQARQREQQELAQARAERDAERQARAHLEARARQLEAELGRDPLELLESRGITAKQIADRILKKGTPEAAVEEALQKVKAREDQLAAELQQLRERDQRAQHAAMQAQARRQLSDTFEGVKAECPILAKVASTPARLEAEYLSAYQRIVATLGPNHGYSDAEILKGLEEAKRADLEEALEAYEVEKLEAALTKRRGSASVTETSSTASGGPVPSAAKVKSVSQTLTASALSSKAGSWKPANFEKLPEREQNRLLVEAMQKGLLSR